MPKGADGLELRLSNSYFVALDNLSSISRNVSDTIARAVTGGSVTKRALYHNTKEIVLDIKALVLFPSSVPIADTFIDIVFFIIIFHPFITIK